MNDTVNGPEEYLVVIGNFSAVTNFHSLFYPYSSCCKCTDPEEIHQTVVGDPQKGYHYPWDFHNEKSS